MRLALAALLAALALLLPASSALAAPSVSVSDVTVAEGNSGQHNATFTVSLSEPAPPGGVTVNYATADGTARQPGDYVATSGVLTIPAGQTHNTVLVPVKGDTLDEVDETFDLNLSSAAGATISDSRGVATITDDDPPPALSVANASRTEGNVNMGFTVRLSRASGREVRVAFATADRSARAPGDYASTTGTLVIPAGSTSRTVGVPIREDSLDEPNETFTLNLLNPSGATISDSQGVGTIADDDAAPSVSIRDARVREGGTAMFAVVLSRASGRTVTVRWSTSARTAAAGSDFFSAAGTATIPTGATAAFLGVRTIGDRRHEANETFRVTLSRPSNTRISDSTATGTIVDDDARPRLSVPTVRPFAFRALLRGGPVVLRGGALVRFVLSEPARVTFHVDRLVVGRRVGGRCLPIARVAQPRCLRWARLRGAFSRAGRSGANRFHLSGRLAGHRLLPGRYRLVAVAVNRLGVRSFVRRAQFRITG